VVLALVLVVGIEETLVGLLAEVVVVEEEAEAEAEAAGLEAQGLPWEETALDGEACEA
jgi:hypothetical protein